jgi:hypothetical protein
MNVSVRLLGQNGTFRIGIQVVSILNLDPDIGYSGKYFEIFLIHTRYIPVE